MLQEVIVKTFAENEAYRVAVEHMLKILRYIRVDLEEQWQQEQLIRENRTGAKDFGSFTNRYGNPVCHGESK